MTKSIKCRHGGVVCGARVTGETDDEVVRKAVDHAREKHGVDLAQSQTLMRYLRSLIREA